MKRVMCRASVLIVLLAAPLIATAKTREPLVLTGPPCPSGSARSAPWVMFEDRDGDGTYDFIIGGYCNGEVRGRPWEGSVQSDPFMPTPNDIAIGRLPVGVVGIAPDFSYQEEASGLYSWTLVERAAGPGGGVDVCRIVRDANMELSTTCDGHQLE